jgi:RNA polymerase sigma-70 factor, ECF subfamily
MSDRTFATDMQAARAGDVRSRGRVLESCRQYLMAIASRGIGLDLTAKTGASDLVQETLLGAHVDFRRFHGESREELLNWLRAILQNRLAFVSRHYRDTEKRRVNREISGGSWEVAFSNATTPGTQLCRRESFDALRVALDRLPEDYRKAVLWHQFDGLGFEEIGARLGRSSESARKLWSRALINLAAEIGRDHAP